MLAAASPLKGAFAQKLNLVAVLPKASPQKALRNQRVPTVEGRLPVFLHWLARPLNAERSLPPRCATLSTTRWTSTGDTGGVAAARAGTGSPTMATSSAPPTGRPLLTTTGGPSTRRPAAALISKSRSQRTTPERAEERQHWGSRQQPQKIKVTCCPCFPLGWDRGSPREARAGLEHCC